ncbi:MAG: zinc-binding dehydrogenase [Verrucomicrobia bacterium]|nr:zinc-binding dehydrogenase [Verrucomicrobiota bacterium]
MKAVIIPQPGKLAIQEIAEPRPSPYEALVKMELCAICNSTDTKLRDGRLPGFNTYPATLGHEGVGIVVRAGVKVRSFKEGDRILNPCSMHTDVPDLASGWGTMAEFALAGDHAAMKADGVCDTAHGYDGVFETQKVIPPDIPSRQAILMATWREVWSSFADFGFQAGRSLLIFGGGPVGLSFVRLTRQFGMQTVVLSTRSQWKLEKARQLGATAVLAADETVISTARKCQPAGYDYVLDAVGSPAVMNQALQLVKFDGVIGVYGTVPDATITLNKQAAPCNWRLIMHQWPDYSKEAAAHEPIARFIREKSISADDFITHEFDFAAAAQGFEALKRNEAIKVILHLPPS